MGTTCEPLPRCGRESRHPMHILILNQTFYPDHAATAQHMWDLARFLVQSGHRVTALASRNVYGTSDAAFTAREVVDGVEIIRVGGTALGKRSIVHRMADFLSFYLAAGFELLRMPAPDAIVALTSPPMISALGGLATRLRRTPSRQRIRFVYYVMDLYPEAAVASKLFRRKGLIDRFFSFFTRRTLKGADGIIALGRDMEQLLLDHYGQRTCGQKIHIIRPWADGKELFPLARSENPLAHELGLADTFNIVYSGNFGIAHDVDTIIKAIELTAGDAGNLRWVFIGAGKRLKQLEEQAREKNWPHVRFFPYQPREILNQSLNLADGHLISQLPVFTGIVVPSKLFGIMAVGKPSIMIGPADCEVSRILSEHHAGVIVPNGEATALVAAVRQSASDAATMGQNARQAFMQHYDVQVACARLQDVITG